MSDNPTFGQMPENDNVDNDNVEHDVFMEDVLLEPITPPKKQIEDVEEVESVNTTEQVEDIKKEERRRKNHIFETVANKDSSTIKDNNAKVHVENSPYKELSEEEWEKIVRKRNDGDISLPTITIGEFKEMVEALPVISLEDSEHNRRLFELYRNMFYFTPRNDLFNTTLEDENRDFSQSLDVEDTKLKPLVPKVSANTGVKYTGEAALIRIQALLGNGSLLSIPLWHSGFWITIKVPSDSRLIDMEHDIMSAKVSMGRNVLGASFTNDQVYLTESIVNLLKECIYSTSVHPDAGDIFDLIQIHDIQTIAWALASIIYPNGYPYQRVVRKEEFSESTIARGMVDISKLFWVDRSKLSDSQKRHMVKRVKPTMSKSSIEDYQKSFKGFDTRRVEIVPRLSAVIGSCSVNQYLQAGQEWIMKCQSHIESILGDEDDDNKRNKLMTNYFQSALLSQYRHFVKSIILTHDNGEEEVNDDYDTVSLILENHSRDDDIRNNLLANIKQFIDDSVVSLIATVSINDEESDNPEYPNLIPLDALYTFFTLVVRRVTKIRTLQLHT